VKSFWTILTALLLAFLPAARSAGSETEKQDCGASCAKCCCCVPPQNSSPRAQNVPLFAPARSISVARIAPVDKTVALPPRFVSPRDSGREPILSSLPATEPLFERYCSLLI
jgi:hypothetical protein